MKTALAFVAMSVVACAALAQVSVTPDDLNNADYGTYPTEYETLVKAWASENLKDPESARYGKISKPRKEYMIKAGKPFYGFSVCAGINAKNAYGGYTGTQTYWFLIRDGVIARAQNTGEKIAGLIPGTTISQGRTVNCSDGDA